MSELLCMGQRQPTSSLPFVSNGMGMDGREDEAKQNKESRRNDGRSHI
jgi:hypothetical protein